MKAKYIVLQQEGEGLQSFISFPPWLEHKKVAEKLESYGKPMGAGFVEIKSTGEIKCSGHSESLGIASRSEDVTWAKLTFKAK